MSADFKVISLVNSKGGAGKTSLAKVLISAAMSARQKVVIFDTDSSENLFSWVEKAKVAGNWPDGTNAYTPTSAKELINSLNGLVSEDFEGLAFVDTAGFAADSTLHMVRNSDMVIVPVLLGADSVETTFETLELLEKTISKLDSDRRPIVRMVRCNVPSASKRTKGHEEVFNDIGNHPLCIDSFISNSSVIELWKDQGPLYTRFKVERDIKEGAKSLNARNTYKVLQEGLAVLNDLYQGLEE